MPSRSAALPPPQPGYRDRRVAISDAAPKAAAGAAVRAFPFAYDTPGLADGAEVGFTPEVGDVLLDAWISVLTYWNGSTAYGDVGTFTGGSFPHIGWFGWVSQAVDMTVEDDDGVIAPSGQGLISQPYGPSSALRSLFDDTYRTSGFWRGLPATFTAADPIKVCVSSLGGGGAGGTTNGDDPGATHGEAILYLMTATPAT